MGYRILFLILLSLEGLAQEAIPKNWSLSGYVKDLQSAFILDNPNQPGGSFPVPPELQFLKEKKLLIADNLLHNRLNFKWYPSKYLSLIVESRNRFFWGDQARLYPVSFKHQLEGANDYFDISWEEVSASGAAFQVMLDRLYLEFNKGNWEIRAGRQRVNWGISTIWNPNDIFNAYNFVDFDYEERPGSDALRVKYYTGFASSVEVVGKLADTWSQGIYAGLWRFNKWSYDVQLLGGYYDGDWVAGAGWAGNLKNAGLKGELSYFRNADGHSLAATINVDYQFENGLFSGIGYLYNSNGQVQGDVSQLFNFQLSAKNLYPFRHAFFVQSIYPATPLLNLGGAVIYSPVEAQALFINPTVTYSIMENWDLDFIAQIVLNNNHNDVFASPAQAGFLRVKWSY